MSQECGCRVTFSYLSVGQESDVNNCVKLEGIDYCPLHASAGKLLAAANGIFQEYDEVNGCLGENDGVDGCGKCEPCLALKGLGEAIEAAEGAK